MNAFADDAPGRACPLRYRYAPTAIARCAERTAATLYVVGGLYGNGAALHEVQRMAAAEPGPVTLCFNGDFHWFDVDATQFAGIEAVVATHDAIQGNVEAELVAADDAAGCGCAYPDDVDADVVERSNRIHARLKATARCLPASLARLAALPMLRRYRVGSLTVGVVHGDAESLAGWRFGVESLGRADALAWLASAFAAAQVEVFASSHTCLPVLRQFALGDGTATVVNNGAAGMPNFRGRCRGLLTRIGPAPSPHAPLYGVRAAGVHIDALEIAYDEASWREAFLAQWQVGSPAHASYWHRITNGPAFAPADATRAAHRALLEA